MPWSATADCSSLIRPASRISWRACCRTVSSRPHRATRTCYAGAGGRARFSVPLPIRLQLHPPHPAAERFRSPARRDISQYVQQADGLQLRDAYRDRYRGFDDLPGFVERCRIQGSRQRRFPTRSPTQYLPLPSERTVQPRRPGGPGAVCTVVLRTAPLPAHGSHHFLESTEQPLTRDQLARERLVRGRVATILAGASGSWSSTLTCAA